MRRNDLDELVRALADRQHQVFTFAQVEPFGVNRALASRRVLVGVWQRPYPNVFRLPGRRSYEGDALAAAWSFKSGLTSHGCAARLLCVPEADPGARVEVLVGENGYQPRPFTVHESLWLPRRDRAKVGPIPVTTISRLLIDLTSRWDPGRLEKAWHGAINEGRTTPARLQTVGVPLIGRGHPGSQVARDLLETCDDEGQMPTESELESALLGVVLAGGYGPVRSQAPLDPLAGIAGRCDFYASHVAAVLEADGRRWHTRIADFERDRHRDNRLQAAGHSVFRFTFDDLMHHRDEVVRVLDRHFERLGLVRDRAGAWITAA